MTTIYIQTDKTNLPQRRDFDHYSTEQNLVKAALTAFAPPTAVRILDIGAGDGRWGIAAKRLTGATQLTGVDIRSLRQPAEFNEVASSPVQAAKSVDWGTSVLARALGLTPEFNPDLARLKLKMKSNELVAWCCQIKY